MARGHVCSIFIDAWAPDSLYDPDLVMRRLVRIALVAAGLAIIALLVLQAGPAMVLDMIARVGWRTVVVAALFTAHQTVRALALQRTILGQRVRFADAFRIRLAGEAVGTLTCAGFFLSEPTKGWLLIRRGVPAAEAFGAVAAEYLVYSTVSAGLVLPAIWLLRARGVVPEPFGPLVPALTALVVAFMGGVVFAAITGVGLIAAALRASGVVVGRSRAARAAELVGGPERVLVSFLHAHPWRLVEVLMIEFVAQTLLLVEIWIVLAALAVSIPDGSIAFVDSLIIEGGTKLIGWVFFFVPGQLGASEAVYVALVGAVGLPAAAGLALALVRRVRSLVLAGAGLVLLAWVGKGTSFRSKL